MKCPVCSCDLRRARSKGVTVDVCSSCAGIWFDSGELQTLLRQLVESETVAPASTRLFQRRQVQTEDESAAEIRCCPQCGMVMKTFNYAYDSNVFVDKCPHCEGIWTDAGEVKRLARHLKEDPRVSVVGQYIHEREQFLDNLREVGDFGQRFQRSGGAAAFLPKIILPVGDDIEHERTPVVTYAILLSCIVVFLLQCFRVSDLAEFFRQYGYISSDVLSRGILTSMFLHGDILHIAGNLLFLWIFGDNVEDSFGYAGYVLFYLAAGAASALSFALFHLDSHVPLIGASGAISGVMGAYFMLYPHARVKLLVICHIIPVPASIYLGLWFALQLTYSVIYHDQPYGVAWLAHAGGFAFGVLAGWVRKRMQNNDRQRAAA